MKYIIIFTLEATYVSNNKPNINPAIIIIGILKFKYQYIIVKIINVI